MSSVFALSRVVGCRTLLSVCAAAAFLALFVQPGCAADSKRVKPSVLPSAAVTTGAPSGAELVGKLLAAQTGPSDPDVPLPQPNLTLHEPVSTSLTGPRLFGRGEDGGAVVGLRIPIPADRGVLQQSTRYGASRTGAE